MPSIQSLTVTYDALNERGTFSEGDALRGRVTLALLKETTVESLFVKAKGDADVRWTRRSGDRTHTYRAHRRYFKLKLFLLPEDRKDTVVPQGIHTYKFSFNIPTGSMPSSFKGVHGSIVYKLEVKLSRSWRMDQTVAKDIHFVSKSYPNLGSLMLRQVGSTKKEMGLFSKGQVHMDVIVDKCAFCPGESIAILAKINNSSSSEMIPKFRMIRDVVYHANSSTRHESTVIHKVVDNIIKSQTQKDVSCAIPIPRDQMPTIQNCDIISVTYTLKAYLDISFAFDPEIVLPVVIIPPGLSNGVATGPYPAGAAGGPSNTDFPPPAMSRSPHPPRDIRGPVNRGLPTPAVSMGPYPASPNSGSYGYPGAQQYPAPPPPAYPYNPSLNVGPPGAYPASSSHVNGGYPNCVPQLASYGSPFPSSSSPSLLHPPPTAPTFHPPPSAPSPTPPPFSISPTAPSHNLLSSAAMMNTDFLSQSDEAPPAYSLLFPSSANDKSDAKLKLMESVWEQQVSGLSTDSRLDSGLDFDFAILTPGCFASFILVIPPAGQCAGTTADQTRGENPDSSSIMSPIKGLSLVYEALNAGHTFSQGDTVAGILTFTLTKETKVKALSVKLKGDANVHWSEGTGDKRRSHNAHRTYLKLKDNLIAKNENGTVLPKGDHQFKFGFTFPHGDMPSSFKGLHGKICYMLVAKVSRSWRMPSSVLEDLNFLSKSSHTIQPICPQSGSVDKKMSGFANGEVEMSATINTNLCSPGDTVSVAAQIRNSSSKQTKTKFSLQQKIVYKANASIKVNDQCLLKMVGEIIEPNSAETASCQFTVPADIIYTLQDCEIISVNHYLKVYLDISFAIDPKVEFPLVVVPSGFANLQPGGALGPYPTAPFGAPSYSDIPPPAYPDGSYPAPAGSGAYGFS
ncbi:uncharacterized protein AB9W97_012869 [Spinachia spinachia]